MKTIDLKSIIDVQGLDPKEIAKQLFPKNKFPRMALKRVLSGDAVLDADQISKLSSLTGIEISDLYSTGNWLPIHSNKKNELIFTTGKFKAVLNRETWITIIFHKKSMFHESVIHAGTTPLNEYLKQLNLIISKYEKDE